MVRNSVKVVGFLIVLAVAFLPLFAQAQTPQQTLTQYISDLQKSPHNNTLRERIIRHVQTMRPAPAIPEEARRYFVKGTTLQKGAKDIGGYGLAVNAYNEALLLAPWWPEAYYNLSLALEQSGRFDDAAGALKLYLLTNPAPQDARAAQDRIYALEAKKEMAAKEVGERAAQASAKAQAGPISGGVSDAELRARATRDGASGVNFINLSRTINGDGWITSFSIYAQSYTHGWQSNSYARKLALLIFRAHGPNFDLVGSGPMQTIPSGGWDRKYTFTIPAIQVKKGDFIGWYYPDQGSICNGIGFCNTSNPGGVIAYDWVSGGGDDVRYTAPWGNQPELMGSVSQNAFASLLQVEGAGRIYSINVSGMTEAPFP